LLAKLKQSVADERAARALAARQKRPYSGDHAQKRFEIADAVSRTELSPELVPLMQWIIDEEPHPTYLQILLERIDRLSSAGAALALSVARKGHPSATVMKHVLEVLAQDTPISLPDDQLARLAQHHRAIVRVAARKLIKALGKPAPPAFRPEKALQRPALRSLLDRIGKELPEAPPATAKLVLLTGEWGKPKDDTHYTQTAWGWLVSRDGNRAVLQVGLRRVSVQLGPSTDHNASRGHSEVKPLAAADAIRHLEEDWVDVSDWYESPVGALVLAGWLRRTGQDGLASRVMLRLLDACDVDDELLWGLRSAVAYEYGEQMLDAFGNARDYPRAMRLARLLVKEYPGSYFIPEARTLLAELPRRMDDFKELKLPTPAQWRLMKTGLTRDEQIDYLCRRLRLTSAGSPYGREQQYAEPADENYPHQRAGVYSPGFPAPTEVEKRRQGKGRTKVIDPQQELGALSLTLKDVPALARQLEEDWHLTAVNDYKVFGLGRGPPTIYKTTRPIIVKMINKLARGPICELRDEWYDYHIHRKKAGPPPSREEVRKRAGEATRWALAHAHMSVADLEWYWYRQARARRSFLTSDYWRFDALRKAGDRRAASLLHETILDPKSRGNYRAAAQRLYAELEPAKARYVAAHLLSSNDGEARLEAAMLCLPTAHAERARQILGDCLSGKPQAGRSPSACAHEIVNALRADGTAASRQTIARLFEGDVLGQMARTDHRKWLLRDLAEAKFVQPYAYYLRLLQSKEATREGASVPAQAVEEICEVFAQDGPTVQTIARKYKGRARIPHLEKWLKERIAALEAKPPAKKEPPPVPGP
jgi:hypothetical protein